MAKVLVHKKTGKPVKVGEQVKDFRGELHTVTGWQEPRWEGSTGRVFITPYQRPGMESGYYPSVIDAHWVEN